jgi:1,4-dihydroxy-2-naphthoate octaprenyltransferase
LVSLPLAIRLYRDFTTKSGSDLNPVLENTAKLLVVFGVLYSVGLAL